MTEEIMQGRNVAARIVVLAALFSPPAFAAEEEVRSAGDVRFVSGGVGEESLERIRALDPEFNLKLLFATRAGEYLADVRVSVTGTRGEGILDTVSEGPWFLARMAPGKVRITAACREEFRTVATAIPATGQREVVFRLECGE
jgi:hypothetical protein